MARPRVPVEDLAKAYAIAQESGVEQASARSGVSKRTVHSILWAMDVAPRVSLFLKKKNPTDATDGGAPDAELGQSAGQTKECTQC